jgi:glycine cleavage system H protein
VRGPWENVESKVKLFKFIDMSKILEGIKYSESHEWVKVEGNIAVIGVSDFAQKEMGDITYVDMPEVEDEVVAGEEFGALESVKASSELISPVSGTVVEVNSELEDTPEKVNEDAYGAWIIKVSMSDASELDNLLDAAGYKALIKE